MARKIYDVVATVGKYTDKQGNEKKRYVNVGAVFEGDNGMSMKLETIPVGPEWSGWLSFYEPKARENSPVTDHSAAKANAYVPDDDDIPF